MKIEISQVIALILGVVSIFLYVTGGNSEDNPVINPLTAKEKAIYEQFDGTITSEVAELVAANLDAGANYIERDSASAEPLLSDDYSIKDLKTQQNKLIWAHNVDLPSDYAQFSDKLWRLYKEELGEEKFTPRDVIELNRTVAKVLRRI